MNFSEIIPESGLLGSKSLASAIDVEVRPATPVHLKSLELESRVQGIPGVCPWVATQITAKEIIIKRSKFNRSILDLVQDEIHGISGDLIHHLLGQMVRTVAQIHALNLVHGCLSLETIKIDSIYQIYMVGLDMLAPFQPGERNFKPRGYSLYYASPQILTGRPSDGPENDVWSLGVCLFILLTGIFLFGVKT